MANKLLKLLEVLKAWTMGCKCISLNYCINLCTGWGNTSWCNKHPINFNVLTFVIPIFHPQWVEVPDDRQPFPQAAQGSSLPFIFGFATHVASRLSHLSASACTEGRIMEDYTLGGFPFRSHCSRSPCSHTDSCKEAEKCAVLPCTWRIGNGLGTDNDCIYIMHEFQRI